MKALTAAQETILSPKTIRERTRAIYEHALRGGTHFRVHPDRIDAAVELTLEVTRRNYPDGKIPVHGRYEHLRAGQVDRIAKLRAEIAGLPATEQAKSLFDLVVVSVLLDAGAGPAWRYIENGKTYTRSEGLAVASYEMFERGMFSSDPKHPYAVDAARLRRLTPSELKLGMQVDELNPMEGVDGRLSLLVRLADSLEEFPELFSHGGTTRPGNLVEYLAREAKNKTVEASELLKALLVGFSKMWPARVEVDGLGLGDTWDYRGDGLELRVPFHKLSQWLTYSLIEPVEAAGLKVTGVEKLTGLPEYRNGGLLLDLGVLELKNPALANERLAASHPAIIEWRALTVQILDEIGDRTRRKLGKSEADLPLACVLQGGTWSAGREIARKLRSDGGPPLKLDSDGTVF